MWLLILAIILIGALTGTLGQILEVAAGLVVGFLLFVLGVVLALSYYVRHRFRKAVREWERGGSRGTRSAVDVPGARRPRRPYGELPPDGPGSGPA